MIDNLLSTVFAWGDKSEVLWVLALTTSIEAITIVLRFGCKLESTRDTHYIGRVTFGLRIHHAYLGVVIVIFSLLLDTTVWVFRIGMALVISDLVHHFLVLWIFTGDPHFDLIYPNEQRSGHDR